MKTACPLVGWGGGKIRRQNEISISKITLILGDVDRTRETKGRRGEKRSVLGSRFRRDLSVFSSGPYYYCVCVGGWEMILALRLLPNSFRESDIFWAFFSLFLRYGVDSLSNLRLVSLSFIYSAAMEGGMGAQKRSRRR